MSAEVLTKQEDKDEGLGLSQVRGLVFGRRRSGVAAVVVIGESRGGSGESVQGS
jgi:hypothetical protein